MQKLPITTRARETRVIPGPVQNLPVTTSPVLELEPARSLPAPIPVTVGQVPAYPPIRSTPTPDGERIIEQPAEYTLHDDDQFIVDHESRGTRKITGGVITDKVVQEVVEQITVLRRVTVSFSPLDALSDVAYIPLAADELISADLWVPDSITGQKAGVTMQIVQAPERALAILPNRGMLSTADVVLTLGRIA